MTSPTVGSNVGRFSATTIALVLGVVTLGIALLTPEAPGKSAGGLSSYSTAPGGAGIAYELARRFGWRTERRIITLDSARLAGDTRTTVQVVLAPREPLGAHEIHNLLENVRHGGGLLFSLDGDDALADSIGVEPGGFAPLTMAGSDTLCGSGFRSGSSERLTLPPEVSSIRWTRHAPGRVVRLVETGRESGVVGGIGFPMGAGHVAIVGGSDVFSNSSMRACRWGGAIAAVKLLEYLWPPAGETPALVFDEFHHGFGVHGGGLRAATLYLLHAQSGHVLAQVLAAGLLLLLAMAPRPLVPRDDTRVIRRSPLEHAAALGRAYEDVRATRTATTALVNGLRRRMRGIVAVPATASDDDFLRAVVQRLPALEPRVAIVNRARGAEVGPREFPAVGAALADIELQLQTTPSTRK